MMSMNDKQFKKMDRVFNVDWHTARVNTLIDQHNEMVAEIETLRAGRDVLSAAMPCSECMEWHQLNEKSTCSEYDVMGCVLGIERDRFRYIVCPKMRIEAAQITRLEIDRHNDAVSEIEALRAERDALLAVMPCSECEHWESYDDYHGHRCDLGIERSQYHSVICPGLQIEAIRMDPAQITRLEIADHVLNPNCSEMVFRIWSGDDGHPYMSKERALKILESIGITEITVPANEYYRDGRVGIVVVLADAGNPNIPDFTRRDKLELLESSDRVRGMHVRASYHHDVFFPTMEKIERAFQPYKFHNLLNEWEEIGDTPDGVLLYQKWKATGIPVPDQQDEEGHRMRRRHVETILNPNCSDVVFRLPGLSREEAVKKLREIGIIEVSSNPDGKYPFLADRDNQMVPDMDSEYGCSMFDIDEWDKGEIVVHGGINLEFSAFPTMKKIQDAFPGKKWEEMIGGSTSHDFDEWLVNGMKMTPRLKKFAKDERKTPGAETKEFRKKVVDPAFAALNPNCSEIVLELPGMAKDTALAKLREIGITEVEIPENVIYNRDSTNVLRVLVDRDNPNCPDFTFHDTLDFRETSGRPDTWRSRAAVRDTLFQMAYARKLPGTGHPEDPATESTPTNGKMLVDLAAVFKKPIFNHADVHAVIDAWPGFSGDGKWYLESVFTSREMFKNSLGHPGTSALRASRMLEIMGNGMIDGKPADDISAAIHEKYPDYDTPSCYFITGSGASALFPTMKKVAVTFGRDWHGHDGGGTASYEEWEDGMEATRIAIEMRARGKTDEQVVAYLEEKYTWCEKVIDAVKRGEPLSIDIADHQGNDGRAKRERYCRV